MQSEGILEAALGLTSPWYLCGGTFGAEVRTLTSCVDFRSGPAAGSASGSRRCGHGTQPAPPLRQPVCGVRLPARDRLAGDRVQPVTRARAGRQRLRRTDHPHAEGATPVGTRLRHIGEVVPPAGGMAAAVRPTMVDRTSWPPLTRRGAMRISRHFREQGAMNYPHGCVQVIGSGTGSKATDGSRCLMPPCSTT